MEWLSRLRDFAGRRSSDGFFFFLSSATPLSPGRCRGLHTRGIFPVLFFHLYGNFFFVDSVFERNLVIFLRRGASQPRHVFQKKPLLKIWSPLLLLEGHPSPHAQARVRERSEKPPFFQIYSFISLPGFSGKSWSFGTIRLPPGR